MLDNAPNQKNTRQRISKILSRSGVCSRKKAEQLIKNNKVSVKGKIVRSFVIEEKDIKDIP